MTLISDNGFRSVGSAKSHSPTKFTKGMITFYRSWDGKGAGLYMLDYKNYNCKSTIDSIGQSQLISASNSCYLSSSSSFIERFISAEATLHTAAAPAIRAAVKTELSNRNDTIAFFFTANKN